MFSKDLDMRYQANRDKMLWTDADLWKFFFLGFGLGAIACLMLILSI